MESIIIYPLIGLNSRCSLYVDEVVDHVFDKEYQISEEKVSYEFQKRGDTILEFLRVKAHPQTGH
ncbi:hypothetical protein [Methanolobus sp.]|uniref:hypothetical protein n=1 Tax=Methanolobus sp. TaxID=1874737 RepID=UPI0025DCB929|nr:hypothetical protein [Methanolobus sp.]